MFTNRMTDQGWIMKDPALLTIFYDWQTAVRCVLETLSMVITYPIASCSALVFIVYTRPSTGIHEHWLQGQESQFQESLILLLKFRMIRTTPPRKDVFFIQP
ncbi:hypothetical protein QF042_002453 [Pedobacter sp. W3I1]|uniref:hypothetical protein n=1 Tax=Pedobacter sp. W3I1 TaxID=3042291 RepID=UPI00278096EE|nr:hypothetical protein [Pedobacter sp. W3I1]MDQ0638888.1 hypothetical protein [Pedobacter sp. W3I1]